MSADPLLGEAPPRRRLPAVRETRIAPRPSLAALFARLRVQALLDLYVLGDHPAELYDATKPEK